MQKLADLFKQFTEHVYGHHETEIGLVMRSRKEETGNYA